MLKMSARNLSGHFDAESAEAALGRGASYLLTSLNDKSHKAATTAGGFTICRDE